MIILAVETSCDDTCIAVLKIGDLTPHQKLRFGTGQGFKILSNIISSQVKLHAKYGGVYPFLAKREHQKNLPIIFEKALKKSGDSKIDLIAVTVGPGLEPCLWTGINFTRDLAQKLNLKIVQVNHIEAHILANWLQPIGEISNPDSINSSSLTTGQVCLNDGCFREYSPRTIRAKRGLVRGFQKFFPAVCLVVSGGHTQLILMKGFGRYKILGETRDDAAGECLDKTARILGLGYPGGPAIAAEAAKLKIHPVKCRFTAISPSAKLFNRVKLPRPMMYSKDYDFSFSGLKTAVLYNFRSRNQKTRKSKQYLQAMAAEIQQAVIDVLLRKTIKAAKDYKAKTVILGGGVAANEELRKQFLSTVNRQPAVNFLVPPKNLCTDNAAMVGVAGCYHHNKAVRWKNIRANANLRIDS